jgi:orotidine-5'-phosphate decarboxylase
MELFRDSRGIIPACDVETLELLRDLVTATSDLPFIQGYKIGMQLVVQYGAADVAHRIRAITDLPIIYDHQKFGTDIPEICGGPILRVLRDAGIDAIIIFPQAGLETLRSTIQGCDQLGLAAIAGGEMTHRAYLVRDGGYIADDAPERMYADAARLGVQHFVVPGTRIDSINRYRGQLEKLLEAPQFLFPGVGKGQGGDIVAAFAAVTPLSAYAIVGRGIYAEKDSRQAAINLWNNVQPQIARD